MLKTWKAQKLERQGRRLLKEEKYLEAIRVLEEALALVDQKSGVGSDIEHRLTVACFLYGDYARSARLWEVYGDKVHLGVENRLVALLKCGRYEEALTLGKQVSEAKRLVTKYQRYVASWVAHEVHRIDGREDLAKAALDEASSYERPDWLDDLPEQQESTQSA